MQENTQSARSAKGLFDDALLATCWRRRSLGLASRWRLVLEGLILAQANIEAPLSVIALILFRRERNGLPGVHDEPFQAQRGLAKLSNCILSKPNRPSEIQHVRVVAHALLNAAATLLRTWLAAHGGLMQVGRCPCSHFVSRKECSGPSRDRVASNDRIE